MSHAATAPAEASAPDPDREAADAPDLMPEWFAHLIALLILFIIARLRAVLRRRLPRPRTAAAASRLAVNASASGAAIARARRPRGATPDNSDLPELSRIIAALRDRMKQRDAEHRQDMFQAMSDIIDAETAPAASPLGIATLFPSRHFLPPGFALRARVRPGTGPPPRLLPVAAYTFFRA